MELRYDACGNESRDRHYRRWQSFSDEMIQTAWRGLLRGPKNSEMNVKWPAREWSRRDPSDIDGLSREG